jgi:hypothetical protein
VSDKPPVDPDKIRRMEACSREIAGHLQKAFDMWGQISHDKEKWGFTLMIFSFSGSEFTYISNANRKDMIKTMMEFIAANPPAKTWDEQHG